ncbi:hypothetical protein BOTBODRAFT_26886 [Botryobasidium botryosum FD-172 SS1]|uniref:CSD domain-containing protein n=1 Tax=Botryobasidium botryosum (strain FD-172 SS1) TaxID=930990 RepID=A0A067MZ51_BOTB1|nr:hypothetical protein BOTBODRAFT_26886 [Botryobasidium botryosum FD-172 SS1]
MARMRGTVAYFSEAKGYGFIRPDDGSTQLYVDARSVESGGVFQTLADGERVEFDVTNGRKGPEAVNVTILLL